MDLKDLLGMSRGNVGAYIAGYYYINLTNKAARKCKPLTHIHNYPRATQNPYSFK